MAKWGEYPDNRLDLRVDENGRITYEQSKEFARYYAPTLEELEEELEDLEYRLDAMELDEPLDPSSLEHDEWEDERDDLEEQIREIEEKIRELGTP